MTLYGGGHMPVYLLWVLSKTARANFRESEVAQMHALAKRIIEARRS